jgi:hypothetical protein
MPILSMFYYVGCEHSSSYRPVVWRAMTTGAIVATELFVSPMMFTFAPTTPSLLPVTAHLFAYLTWLLLFLYCSDDGRLPAGI